VQALARFQNPPASLRRLHSTAPAPGRFPHSPFPRPRLAFAPSPPHPTAVSGSATAIQTLRFRLVTTGGPRRFEISCSNPCWSCSGRAQGRCTGRHPGYRGPGWHSLLSARPALRRRLAPYCPQSIAPQRRLVSGRPELAVEPVLEAGRAAKAAGAHRFAWTLGLARIRDWCPLRRHAAMVAGVRPWPGRPCVTPACSPQQAERRLPLASPPIPTTFDTSPRFHGRITHAHLSGALETLARVRRAGLTVCCGASSAWARADTDGAGLLQVARQPRSPTRERADQLPPPPWWGARAPPRKQQEPLDPLELVRIGWAYRSDADALSRGAPAAPAAKQLSREAQILCLQAGGRFDLLTATLLTRATPIVAADRCPVGGGGA